MAKIETPHIKLMNDTGFGKTVLMPGDPVRAEFTAERFLENPVPVNNVRGVKGYTGTYNGVKVSVMASGMGMPSIGIYSYELFKFFDVQNIIRIGSAGSISPECKLMDLVAGTGACTDSDFASQYGLSGTVAPVCDFDLLSLAKAASAEKNIELKTGSLFSTDVFYNDTRKSTDWAKMGCLAVEMEAAALYMNAMRLGKRALAICTISDLCYEPFDELSPDERSTGFTAMMEVALLTAAKAETLDDLKCREN
ncbi:MAG: purine-nucleoside phosphorylase [Clostridia bacterium]|nr:purine-nucleoside phosphorylase [Clostridia bacterium]